MTALAPRLLASCPCGSAPVVVTFMVVGALATAAGWYAVARRGASVWVVFGVLNGALGILAVATGKVSLSPKVAPGASGLAGLGAGVLLYLATVGFVSFVRRWPAFAKDVTVLYGRGAGLSLPVALGLASGLAAPGEELFWRGLFAQHLSSSAGRVPGAALTWVAYVAANTFSLSLPITAAAVVGGAAWALLAAWTGGVLASLICHAVWTGLMLVFPPPGGVRPSEASAEPGPPGEPA